MDDDTFESATTAPATNNLSGSTFKATIKTRGNTKIRPPKVAGVTIDSWAGGAGLEFGQVIVHFDPATLHGIDETFLFDVICGLSAPDGASRACSEHMELTDLQGVPIDLGVNSEAPATGYATVNGLMVEVSMYLSGAN